MCTYSAFIDQIRTPMSPNYVPWTPTSPDPQLAQQILEIIKRLDAIDKKLGLKDCSVEAQVKAEFVAQLEERANSDHGNPRTNS